MALEIANSSAVTVAVDLTNQSGLFSGLGSTADSLLAALNSELMFDGLTIATKSIGASGIFYPLTGEFSATLTILNQSGQELDDTDLTAQFYDAAKQLNIQVNSFAVQQITGAPSGVNSGTGTQGNVQYTGAAPPAKATPTVHACGDPSWGFFDDPAQWIQCLTSKGLSTVGLLAIGLVIGIVLIVGVERKPSL